MAQGWWFKDCGCEISCGDAFLVRNREGGDGNDAGAGELNMAGQAAVLLLPWCTVCLEWPRGGSAVLT